MNKMCCQIEHLTCFECALMSLKYIEVGLGKNAPFASNDTQTEITGAHK